MALLIRQRNHLIKHLSRKEQFERINLSKNKFKQLDYLKVHKSFHLKVKQFQCNQWEYKYMLPVFCVIRFFTKRHGKW